jgi:hypothetical protein
MGRQRTVADNIGWGVLYYEQMSQFGGLRYVENQDRTGRRNARTQGKWKEVIRQECTSCGNENECRCTENAVVTEQDGVVTYSENNSVMIIMMKCQVRIQEVPF